jgi:ATP-dependent helicase/nuclease subunit A
MSGRDLTPAARALLAGDDSGRRAAQTEFELPLLLEAGAGTGKTTTLIHRILAWSLGSGWLTATAELVREADDDEPAADRVAARALEGIVAVTFTEAAAAEMAARVAEGLARVASGAGDKLPGFAAAELPEVAGVPLERRAAALLGAIDHLTVSTIHAWCRGLLATHAVDAGLHPDFGVDPTGERTEAVAREVAEEAIRRAYGAGERDDPLVRLAGFGYGPHRLAEALAELARRAVPAELLRRDPFEPAVLEALVGELDEALAALLEPGQPLAAEAGRLLGPQVLTAVIATRQALAALPAEPLARAEALAEALAGHWPGNLSGRLKSWHKGKFSQTEEGDLGDGAAELGRAAGRLRPLVTDLGLLRPRLLDTARRALAPLLEETARRLRSQGIAGFDSLLIDARELLSSHPDVRRQIRARLRQLLVDEFQDTDRVQCDLVRLLALEGKGARPGLFLVGDPKQSIYGWRNADLGAYDAFARDLERRGGARYVLCRNFRSAPPILDEVERAVAPVMVQAEGLQPRFEPLLPSAVTRGRSGFRHGGWAPVEYWVASFGSSRRGQDDEELAELEARAVAADVRRLHDERGVEWREVGILLRSGSRVDTFESALRSAGVPFSVSRDRQYFRRREIIDAAALVRAIVDPDDHVALLAYLRSAAAGVPDAALIPLWGRGFPRLVTELERPTPARLEPVRQMLAEVAAQLPAELPGLDRIDGWHLSAAAAIERLVRLRRAFAEEPADRFVESLRRLTMTEVTEAARYLGQFRVANLDRLFRGIEEALAERGGDIQAVLRALRRSLREAVEPDEQRPHDPTEDAAQVLTVHSAKGLEFGHLYLVETHAGTGGAGRFGLDLDERWASRERLEYALFGSPTPSFYRVRQERRQVEAAERVRTLYVALTRARERLVLVGRWPAQPRPGKPETAASFGDLLCSRGDLPDDLEALRQTAVDGRVDHGEARWVFLDPAAAAAVAPARTARGPSPAGVAGDEKTLAGLRRDADGRMGLPLGRAASAEAAARLERLSSGGGSGAGGGNGDETVRDVAMAVGVAVHRMLEMLPLDGPLNGPVDGPLDGPPAAAKLGGLLDLARARVATDLAATLPAPLLPVARERAGELLDRLASGSLLRRLGEIGPAVVGREVPILLPADEGAAGYVSGALDLIYTDAASGRLTIVDFKTDRVDDEAAIAERAAAYHAQEALYARAVRLAFGLDYQPATELWFLWPDRLWTTP